MADSTEPEGSKNLDTSSGRPTAQTTIVGALPPGSTRPQQGIPRGIEALIKKASVDDKFRTILPAKRAEAPKGDARRDRTGHAKCQAGAGEEGKIERRDYRR